MTVNNKVSNYKPAEDREKDLKLSLIRIQKGRSRTGETKVSIAAVAREAGVSTALIHNHYPQIAEAIRDAQGRSSRATRDAKQNELTAERKKSAAYRQELNELKAKIQKLASINEVLIEANRILKAKVNDAKVVDLPSKNSQR
ncbi:Transcriptional regulator, tetR family [Pseudomonas sp. JV551A1]|uniref:Transcriptional regulator, tetR family n=1 Tax=Pseudomonas inefficax TaxID=2078786 RepID=A0AAQ1PA60_9PSED|nr:TetR family transcriptional regulator [Pseudomonas]SPO54158.1 Transcriptional regulator, tetR family [Pseudomonas sp. JV551A1]SPO60439.1 Transcriptional regulator, tetR family [Pseudomonas inefficax]